MWQGRGVLFLSLKMSQNSIDDSLLLDTGDDSDRSAAAADLDVYIEYALESLSPGHRRMSLRCRADLHIGNRLDSFSTPGWRDQPSPAVVRSFSLRTNRSAEWMTSETGQLSLELMPAPAPRKKLAAQRGSLARSIHRLRRWSDR